MTTARKVESRDKMRQRTRISERLTATERKTENNCPNVEWNIMQIICFMNAWVILCTCEALSFPLFLLRCLSGGLWLSSRHHVTHRERTVHVTHVVLLSLSDIECIFNYSSFLTPLSLHSFYPYVYVTPRYESLEMKHWHKSNVDREERET